MLTIAAIFNAASSARDAVTPTISCHGDGGLFDVPAYRRIRRPTGDVPSRNRRWSHSG